MFIARWDLDKTYLRTDFDTLRDLVRTAFERPDQKRTVPGAAALMRELDDAKVEIHILSGSPEQLRGRLTEKLELDGVRYASLTLKPNFQNLLRLRLRAVRAQLGYKLTALLRGRCELPQQKDLDGRVIREALFGDDAEADAFVYSLYADVCLGRVGAPELASVMRAGGCYDDEIADAVRYASYLERAPTVERILIHLDRQSSPAEFDALGPRVVPFYNYLQAAFVLYDDGRLSPRAVLKIAQELAVRHHFDGAALGQSYLELTRRGHLSRRGLDLLATDYAGWIASRNVPGASELSIMLRELSEQSGEPPPRPARAPAPLDYPKLLAAHNPRRRKHR